MTQFTISKLGAATNLPAKTIRYYEEIGLIKPAQRADNGYRLYEVAAIEELRLIKRARDLGLPISKIKKLMTGCTNHQCQHSQQEILTEINDFLGIVDARITQFTTLRDRLQQLQNSLTDGQACRTGKYCCNILYQLAQGQKGDEHEPNSMLRQL
jgi:MerR family transcriptional regulator, copper efflux regulator